MEITRLLANCSTHDVMYERLVAEEESLKSQIESKLAQADNPSRCPICQGRGFVPEGFYSTTTGQWNSTSTLTEKCRSCNGLGIIQNSNQQELSQLRPIVQKIQNQIQNLKEHHKTGYRSNPDCYEWGVTLLESILASSDYVQMENGKVTLHTDNTYTTHHSECKCDKCGGVK